MLLVGGPGPPRPEKYEFVSWAKNITIMLHPCGNDLPRISNEDFHEWGYPKFYWLVVGPPRPEKYEFVSWDDEIPNIWENAKNVPTNQIGLREHLQESISLFRGKKRSMENPVPNKPIH